MLFNDETPTHQGWNQLKTFAMHGYLGMQMHPAPTSPTPLDAAAPFGFLSVLDSSVKATTVLLVFNKPVKVRHPRSFHQQLKSLALYPFTGKKVLPFGFLFSLALGKKK